MSQIVDFTSGNVSMPTSRRSRAAPGFLLNRNLGWFQEYSLGGPSGLSTEKVPRRRILTVAGVGSTSTNRLRTTVPSIPNARAVGPPTGRSTFLEPKVRRKKHLFFGPVRAVVLRPAYRQHGSGGPLRRTNAPNTLVANGLGAARGQRPRKGSCASYPTRQIPRQFCTVSGPLRFVYSATASIRTEA